MRSHARDPNGINECSPGLGSTGNEQDSWFRRRQRGGSWPALSMKARPAAVLLAGVLLAGAAHGAGDVGLPAWTEAERADGEVGTLLRADAAAAAAVDALDLEPPSAEDIAATAIPADEVPEKFWPAYFGERPRTFLVDPQGLLNSVDFRDRLAFLNYHAGDSTIDLYVYLFKGDQEIPGEVREEELVERLFSSGRPAAIVYYYLGAPPRSVLYLSPSLMDAVPVAERRRALESSVMQAVAKVDPSSQLETFLVQMSIRIYWMERLIKGAGTTADARPAVDRAVPASDKKAALLAKVQALLESVRRFALVAAVVAGALLLAALTGVWLRRRARYQFPGLVVEPRLGGRHAAGVGAVISFASATLSPAAQREHLD